MERDYLCKGGENPRHIINILIAVTALACNILNIVKVIRELKR
nr:MAG TPA: hypothetical protein [Caudoviricetes sp.]